MSPVEPCSTSDVEEVARLHAKVFLGSPEESTEGLEQYYRETFFEHPWVDPRISPLIAREKGRIAGFLGVIPRTMRFHGEPITVAVLHRGVVDPEIATPFTARAIFHEMLHGPQGLSVSDVCNHEARRVWESLHGEVVHASSIDWFMPLRPCAFTGALLKRRGRIRPFARLARPLFALGDSVADAMGRSWRAIEASVTFREVSDSRLLEAMTQLTAKRPLVSEYSQETWSWILSRVRQNEERGRFETRLAMDSRDRIHGACAWYVRPDRTMDVLLLVLRPSKAEAVLGALFRYAGASGLIAVTGRLDSEVMRSSWIRKCRLEQRHWSVVHGGDPRLRQLFHSGESMSTGLDFELWVPYPAAEYGSWPG